MAPILGTFEKFAALKTKYAALEGHQKDISAFCLPKYAAFCGIYAAYMRLSFKRDMSYLLCMYLECGKCGTYFLHTYRKLKKTLLFLRKGLVALKYAAFAAAI